MAELELKNVHKSFGAIEIIKGVDLSFASGEFVVFVGPSGCGKSTLLRMIAGLEGVTSGQINIDRQDVTSTEPSKRGIAMVFQSYALYPHMSVEENMGFGLEMAGIAKVERQRMVLEAARILNLELYLERKPKALSGGQRQRVAIGRAIVRKPKIFLFDEPLSNLDAELRVRMRLEIASLHRRLGATMVYVTHDQIEAMTLATRIVALRAGVVEQVGSPMELYKNPDNMFVAGFIGSPRMNFVPAKTLGMDGFGNCILEVAALGIEKIHVPLRKPQATLPSSVTLGIRPEHLSEQRSEGSEKVSLVCDIVEQLGNVSYVHARANLDNDFIAEWRRLEKPSSGDELTFWISPEDCLLFDPDGRRL